jgi:hypothetical protein
MHLKPAQGVAGFWSESAIDRAMVKPGRFEPFLHTPHQGQYLGLRWKHTRRSLYAGAGH